MGFDEHPFLFLYLAGCVLVVILILVKVVLFSLLEWITKANVSKKNLKKLAPPDKRPLVDKAVSFITVFGIEVALSWVNVAVLLLWHIPTTLLQALRELLSSTPEAIKVLRFPLRNNPDMPRESVWAYVVALGIKAGQKQPSESDLRSGVDELLGYCPSFDRAAALKQLMALNVMSSDVVSAVLDRLSSDPAPTVPSSDDDEPYIVDDEPWEDGSSWTHLYPSQRKFMRHAWWIPGESNEHYEYRVDSDKRVTCRLYLATETGTKSGDAPFDERFYQDLTKVKDGVVVEDAVRLIRGDDDSRLSEEMAELTAKTEWHELTLQSSGWPELWFRIVKFHVGEYEARHEVRKELERLKRAMRIITEQTSQYFTLEHHEKYLFSEFKPLEESASNESNGTILGEALRRSGISMDEAQGAHFQIRRLSALLDGTKTESEEEESERD